VGKNRRTRNVGGPGHPSLIENAYRWYPLLVRKVPCSRIRRRCHDCTIPVMLVVTRVWGPNLKIQDPSWRVQGESSRTRRQTLVGGRTCVERGLASRGACPPPNLALPDRRRFPKHWFATDRETGSIFFPLRFPIRTLPPPRCPKTVLGLAKQKTPPRHTSGPS